jgi:hypothetical protein
MTRSENTSSAQVLKKPQPEELDLVVLGGGTGSTLAAWTFAGEGKRVAVDGWPTQARFWLEWGCSDFLNSVIPTGTDHREAMICGVESLP